MRKNNPAQQRLLEIGGLVGMDDSVEALRLLLQRGFKRELEDLRNGIGIDLSEYENVTKLPKVK